MLIFIFPSYFTTVNYEKMYLIAVSYHFCIHHKALCYAIYYICSFFISPSYFIIVNYEKMYFILGDNIQKAEASNMIDWRS